MSTREHLLCEIAFIIDVHDSTWAKRMKRLFVEAYHAVGKRKEKCLSDEADKALQKRYRTHPHPRARSLK